MRCGAAVIFGLRFTVISAERYEPYRFCLLFYFMLHESLMIILYVYNSLPYAIFIHHLDGIAFYKAFWKAEGSVVMTQREEKDG